MSGMGTNIHTHTSTCIHPAIHPHIHPFVFEHPHCLLFNPHLIVLPASLTASLQRGGGGGHQIASNRHRAHCCISVNIIIILIFIIIDIKNPICSPRTERRGPGRLDKWYDKLPSYHPPSLPSLSVYLRTIIYHQPLPI